VAASAGGGRAARPDARRRLRGTAAPRFRPESAADPTARRRSSSPAWRTGRRPVRAPGTSAPLRSAAEADAAAADGAEADAAAADAAAADAAVPDAAESV